MPKMRSPSHQTLLVLRALLDAPDHGLYGLQICHAADLASGTIHPILARLETNGLVESTWEDADDARKEGRPPRRYYSLNRDGAEFARRELAAAQSKVASYLKLFPGAGLGGGAV